MTCRARWDGASEGEHRVDLVSRPETASTVAPPPVPTHVAAVRPSQAFCPLVQTSGSGELDARRPFADPEIAGSVQRVTRDNDVSPKKGLRSGVSHTVMGQPPLPVTSCTARM